VLKTETCRTNNFPTRRRARLPATVVTPLAEVAGVLDEEETRDEEEAPVEAAAPTQDIVEIAVADGRFTTSKIGIPSCSLYSAMCDEEGLLLQPGRRNC